MSKTWRDAYDPSWITGIGYNCRNQGLTSLEGAPSHVDGDFWCGNNKLTSLEGGPFRVHGDFICSHNELVSLKGAPSHIHGSFSCRDNQLTSLEGAPSSVSGYFNCSYNQLTSLKDIHLQIKHVGGQIFLHNNQDTLESHVLGLLLIDGLTKATIGLFTVDKIINKYLPSKGMESVLLCQEELILAGFGEYAQL